MEGKKAERFVNKVVSGGWCKGELIEQNQQNL